MVELILQNSIFTNYAFPFLLIFFIVYGALEKSKLFGEKTQKLSALISFVVGLIFVGAVFPKLVVGNLILFLTIAMVTLFVAMLLWGFVAGEGGLKFSEATPPLKWFIGVVIVITVIAGLLWALGTSLSIFKDFFDFVFRSSWSKDFWTNAAFIIVVIFAIAIVLGKSESHH